MIYTFKTAIKTVMIEDVKEIAAAFLYEQQNGKEPHWVEYPGDYETRDFYSIHDSEGKFLELKTEEKVVLLDSFKEAEKFAHILGAINNKKYYVYPGGINSNGFIAGPEDTIVDWDDEFFAEWNDDISDVEWYVFD